LPGEGKRLIVSLVPGGGKRGRREKNGQKTAGPALAPAIRKERHTVRSGEKRVWLKGKEMEKREGGERS